MRNKNGSPIGRTIKTKDEFLPAKDSKVHNKKERRWVAVIDKNSKEELAVVRLTTQKQKNSSLLVGYCRGNKKETYFKHFVEIKDNEGKPIKVDGKKFVENNKTNDLTGKQVKEIKKRVFKHSRQSENNKKNIVVLKSKEHKK